MGNGIPRHWWGKIIGTVVGIFRGGLMGAVIGFVFGHLVDRFLGGILGVGATREAFFDGLFSALGHLAKADGRVSESEIRMVESLMARMQITGEERRRAIRLFNQGKQAGFDLEAGLRPFAQHAMARPDLRRMFMEILVEAAFSSGEATENELAVLQRVARDLHIAPAWFAAMLQARGGSAGAGSGRRGAAGVVRGSLEQAYAQLGLKPGAGDAEVKRAYRKLVSQYHPDKLVARGLPEEMMEMARSRVRDINTAYDQIKEARGIK
ncbi:co-chaperone DjlA [Elongatibacter sediminis]